MNNLNLLEVHEFNNKTRYGCNNDGGYVIAELDETYDCYISAGISNEESFSRDFINKHNMNNNYAFDGTIDEYPIQYTENITFFKKNIFFILFFSVINFFTIYFYIQNFRFLICKSNNTYFLYKNNNVYINFNLIYLLVIFNFFNFFGIFFIEDLLIFFDSIFIQSITF